MLRSRIIPCLLVHNKGLVKTKKFSDPKYVGDPINAVKIFNEKLVDELIVLDIDATRDRREPDYEMIRNLASECRMPLCYGGGVSTVEQAVRISNLGVEKVAISASAFESGSLIEDMVAAIGKQSVVVVLDVKKTLWGSYDVYIRNGKKKVKGSFKDILRRIEERGAGEIVVNSIDCDGVMQGYDLKLIELTRKELDIPLTVLGGAGTLEHIKEVVDLYRPIGVAAGSLFVFKGKFRAVLINYPSVEKKKDMTIRFEGNQ
ncbi:AglZ/HisF2 family acetamidino modification protein [Pseudidiomarina terrestris]|uniref:AglZ/HisF2 family acetamidino modification protein n=1 Tax=Pseudidiomarina terrestris TaxID=2820060 RepID=UPI00265409C9|nr:AglZ/HisF2 family acetamidino modification protein [Pseudidiomarina sp. 1ASP75-5]MDN7134542.1 imidazole glycerol phosphate synthase subunit HisF [Pseudidiomarina sp. 1ASP75-5]